MEQAPLARHAEALPPDERKLQRLHPRANGGQPGAPAPGGAVRTVLPGGGGGGGGGDFEVAVKCKGVVYGAEIQQRFCSNRVVATFSGQDSTNSDVSWASKWAGDGPSLRDLQKK